MELIRYGISKWDREPKKKVFVRETKSCLFDASGKKELKECKWYKYYETLDEAVAEIARRKKHSDDTEKAIRISKSAPALLEALEDVIESFWLSCEDSGDEFSVRPEIIKARSAIKQARGE